MAHATSRRWWCTIHAALLTAPRPPRPPQTTARRMPPPQMGQTPPGSARRDCSNSLLGGCAPSRPAAARPMHLNFCPPSLLRARCTRPRRPRAHAAGGAVPGSRRRAGRGALRPRAAARPGAFRRRGSSKRSTAGPHQDQAIGRAGHPAGSSGW
eukprot:scaffold14196_cov104-Isochrysis_galbana.AAC.3